MGLLNCADHSRRIWNKMIKKVMSSHHRSCYAALGVNWARSTGIENVSNTLMHTNMADYWKLSMYSLRKGGWTFKTARAC